MVDSMTPRTMVAGDRAGTASPASPTDLARVFDLEGLEFCDSTGLAALLGAHKTLSDNGGTLELLAPNPMLVNLVRITGLDDVFEVRLPDPKPEDEQS